MLGSMCTWRCWQVPERAMLAAWVPEVLQFPAEGTKPVSMSFVLCDQAAYVMRHTSIGGTSPCQAACCQYGALRCKNLHLNMQICHCSMSLCPMTCRHGEPWFACCRLPGKWNIMQTKHRPGDLHLGQDPATTALDGQSSSPAGKVP